LLKRGHFVPIPPAPITIEGETVDKLAYFCSQLDERRLPKIGYLAEVRSLLPDEVARTMAASDSGNFSTHDAMNFLHQQYGQSRTPKLDLHDAGNYGFAIELYQKLQRHSGMAHIVDPTVFSDQLIVSPEVRQPVVLNQAVDSLPAEKKTAAVDMSLTPFKAHDFGDRKSSEPIKPHNKNSKNFVERSAWDEEDEQSAVEERRQEAKQYPIQDNWEEFMSQSELERYDAIHNEKIRQMGLIQILLRQSKYDPSGDTRVAISKIERHIETLSHKEDIEVNRAKKRMHASRV